MSKFIKRIGTKAYKFHVDIYLKKFEMTLLAGSPNCKCLLIFKRGDHTLKTKNAVTFQNKEAVFTEVLSHISTLYYKKKKKKYLPKKAEIDIVLFFADNQQKAAGTVYLDLADYPNAGIKKKVETLIVDNSPDKTAKLIFEIRMKKLGEVEDPENDSSFIQSNQPFKKGSIKPKAPDSKNDKNPKDQEKVDKKPGPAEKKPLEKSASMKSQKEEISKNTKGTIVKTTGAENPNNSRPNLLNISKKPVKKQSSSESSGSEGSEDEGSEASSGSSRSGSGSGSGSASESEEEPKPKPQRKTSNILTSKNLGNNSSVNNGRQLFNNNNDLNLSNIKSVKTVNSDDQLSMKIKSLLKDSNNGSKDSTKIEPNLKKLENEEKKIGMPNFGKQQEDSDDGEAMFAEFSAQKIKQLELKLNAKTKENQENLAKIQDLEEETRQLKEENTKLGASIRASIGTPTFESKYLEKESEIKALKLETLELRNALKMKDLEIKEKGLTLARNSIVDTSQLESLKQSLDGREKMIKENERKIKELEEKCRFLEDENKRTLEMAESIRNSSSANKASKVSEEFYKKKIENLTEEVCSLKRQLEENIGLAEMTKLELESEISRLKIENSSLLKHKLEKPAPSTIRNKPEKLEEPCMNPSASFSELQVLKDQIRNLESEKRGLESENKRLGDRIIEKDREINTAKDRTDSLELEVQKSKMKLAEVLNVAFETGGVELVELIENAVVDQRISISTKL